MLALNLGADDCVEELLEISEVVARVEGLLRRMPLRRTVDVHRFAAICIDILMLFSFQAQLIWLVGPAFAQATTRVQVSFHPHFLRAIVSLGARWAFSLQRVLPSVWRPVVLLSES